MQFPANLTIDMVIISDPQLKKRRTSQCGQEGVVSSADRGLNKPSICGNLSQAAWLKSTVNKASLTC
jgi:hypothetical protein